MRSRYRSIGLLLVAACAAGASGSGRAAMLLSAAPPPEGRTCHVAAEPPALPAVGAVVDSPALAGGVRSGAESRPGSVLFSLRFDNQGRLTSIRAIESTLSAGIQDSISRATVGALRTQPPGPPWSVRLKVTADTAPEIRIGRSELCPAVPAGFIDITVSGRVLSSSGVPPSAQQLAPATPHFQILVDSTGRLVEITLRQSSGQTDVDQQVESALRNKNFHPTLLDGAPILAWTQWPLRQE